MSHPRDRRWCRGVGPLPHGRGGSAAAPAPAAVRPVQLPVATRRTEREGGAVSSPPTRGTVRADLEPVFRADYARVVGVAARVLGSRDEAEDVAQEVFLSFGRSAVPAAEAS